jgi:hypothetical protein
MLLTPYAAPELNRLHIRADIDTVAISAHIVSFYADRRRVRLSAAEQCLKSLTPTLPVLSLYKSTPRESACYELTESIEGVT